MIGNRNKFSGQNVKWIVAVTAIFAASSLVTACSRSDRDDLTTRAEKSSEDLKRSGEKMKVSVNDATITAKVKAAYLADEAVKGLKINVTTNEGVVTLDGSVASEREHQRAIQIAQGTEGVARIDDKLRVN